MPELQRFFKTERGGYGEGDVFLGVRVPAARKVARRFDLELEETEELLRSPLHEERLVALLVLVRRFERGDEPVRRALFDLYLESTDRVNSWDLVDVSAPSVVGGHLLDRPRDVLDRLARSVSVWERRIAIVATLTFIRAGQHDDTLRLSRVLLRDEHDLIRKAVGWMLREVGKRDEPSLVRFLEDHAPEMPRVMLRYALERLGAAERRRLMEWRPV